MAKNDDNLGNFTVKSRQPDIERALVWSWTMLSKLQSRTKPVMQAKLVATPFTQPQLASMPKLHYSASPLQRRHAEAAMPAASTNQVSNSSSAGNGLPEPVRQGMEAMSGISLADVEVERNSSKPAKVDALAYAQGKKIYLGPGQEKHLPHEAWHVVQQAQGRVKPTMQMKGGVAVNDNPSLEREADVMAMCAAQSRPLEMAEPIAANNSYASTPAIQRVQVDKSELSDFFLLGDFIPNFGVLKAKVIGQSDQELLTLADTLTQKQIQAMDVAFKTDLAGRISVLRAQRAEVIRQQEVLAAQLLALQARAADKTALAGKFNVDDDVSHHTKGNDVDTATFDAVAKLYSDIREGITSLKISYGFGGASMQEVLTFQNDVLGDIAKILQTSAGRKLLTFLAQGSKAVNVGSSGMKGLAHQMPHADSQSLSDIFANKPKTFNNSSNDVGTGSDVKYVPNDYTGTLIIDGQLTTTDTVLFHELTHAAHAAIGKRVAGTLAATDTGMSLGHKDLGVNKEEYATVGLGDYENNLITENAYRAQQRAVLGDGEWAKLMYGKRNFYNGPMS